MVEKAHMSGIGVLMIGSLYWDCRSHRREWRDKRLEMCRSQPVRVPIRYGRRSRSRGCTYTMVFSAGLTDPKYGHGIVVPCKSQDLIEEAECLWTAETACGENSERRISKGWGCVAVLENPEHPMSEEARSAWIERVVREPCYGKLNSAIGESVVVDRNGFLRLGWPSAPDGSELTVNVLLATATNPTIVRGDYARADDIAAAWMAPHGTKHDKYFWNNRNAGIQTFQDDEIERLLGRQAHQNLD